MLICNFIQTVSTVGYDHSLAGHGVFVFFYALLFPRLNNETV